jgi:hypothetical protein
MSLKGEEMMKVGIMQPYLFPYLGYFQLINTVDTFVIYDDVQFIKDGWINRNTILLNNKAYLFTFSIQHDSVTKNINERFYSERSFESTKEKFFKTISLSYAKSPHYREVYELLQKSLNCNSFNVAEFNTYNLKVLCDYLGIETKIMISSQIKKNQALRSQDRVIEINKILGGDCYINAIGGMELYSKSAFEENGIKLRFIKMKEVTYPQLKGVFIPSLSIIDVLMFNSQKQIMQLLHEYELI